MHENEDAHVENDDHSEDTDGHTETDAHSDETDVHTDINTGSDAHSDEADLHVDSDSHNEEADHDDHDHIRAKQFFRKHNRNMIILNGMQNISYFTGANLSFFIQIHFSCQLQSVRW